MDNTERIRLLEGYQKTCRLRKTEAEQEDCTTCDVCRVAGKDE